MFLEAIGRGPTLLLQVPIDINPNPPITCIHQKHQSMRESAAALLSPEPSGLPPPWRPSKAPTAPLSRDGFCSAILSACSYCSFTSLLPGEFRFCNSGISRLSAGVDDAKLAASQRSVQARETAEPGVRGGGVPWVVHCIPQIHTE